MSLVVHWISKVSTLVLDNILPSIRSNQSTSATSIGTENAVCHEDAFRYLLQAEFKRSQRSGHGFYIVLLYRIDGRGTVLRMDSHVASLMFNVLSESVRETDYFGWYLEGRVVGGVLTVVGQDCAGGAHARVQRQLKASIQERFGSDSGQIQVQLCRQDELQELKFDEEEQTVQ